MPISFKTYDEAVAALAATGVASGDPLKLPLAQARARQQEYFAALAGDLPPIERTEDIQISGPAGPIPLRFHVPRAAGRRGPVVLFICGAGWWAGSLDSHARTMRLLAILTGCEVCGIDYRRTPEFHYPVQKNEVVATIRWLTRRTRELGAEPARIVIVGESAGATLALSAAQELRDAHEASIGGLVLFYGNFAGPRDGKRPYSQWVWEQYLGAPQRAFDPHAVPLLGDMHDLPPVWLGVGERDPLLADTLDVAAKLDRAGTPCELVRYPDMPHAFVMWTGVLGPAMRALEDAAGAARRMLERRTPQETHNTGRTSVMERITPTQEEMKSRIARFKDVVPTKKRHLEEKGIPAEVLEMITAHTTRNIMSPGPMPGQLTPKPTVEGGDAGVFRLGIVSCPPGNGPGLHVHYKTHETFMALTGRWEIQWGDKGQEKIELDPFDLIAVPPKVTRRFVNISGDDAHLLVIIQGQREEFDDVDRVPETAAAIAARYGQGMVDKLQQLGWKFTIGVNEAKPQPKPHSVAAE